MRHALLSGLQPVQLAYCSGHLGRTPLRLQRHKIHPTPGKHCSGHLGRTPLRLTGHGNQKLTCAELFRPSRPDSIETLRRLWRRHYAIGLFRPSRPDSIETPTPSHDWHHRDTELFRPSRPDSIETSSWRISTLPAPPDCSGHLGRTPLRHGLVLEREGVLVIVPAI